ncbi:hypothetical protein [Acrocarpospora sp. B8E8]|uniref:hypothetical protein n=1 Tax=Acrocarpospora sp. B8E8 TaxID=3153572 RepID=UPI00325FB739
MPHPRTTLNADLPLTLALTAGLVAAFNPCGFALLPAYLTMLIADQGASRRGPMLSTSTSRRPWASC